MTDPGDPTLAGARHADPAAPAPQRGPKLHEMLQEPAVVANIIAAAADGPGGSVTPRVASEDSQDERVRTLLARRIAVLLPTLDQATQTQLRRHVLTMLFKLVEDECVRVRAAIADVLKDMEGAPHELVLRLASDIDSSVCEPVIRLSPLLLEEDLLTLLRAPPSPDTATAVARRPGLTEALCDAVVQYASSTAVGALLANHSAAIREATLNALVERAAIQTEWQEPLVRRPKLSTAAATALSSIVTTRLLEFLARRDDLAPAVTEQLRQRLAERPRAEPPQGGQDFEVTSYQALQQASKLRALDRLHEVDLLEALQRGEARLATALLAVAAGVPLAVVDRAASLRSAKGLVSLVWKAGFTMQAAAALQVLLARLPPAAVLMPGPNGGFPLMVAEMRWQLAFLNRLTRGGID